MAVCDKWVALKIVEFLVCVSCLVAKRVSQDDEARLALLLQKLSREWSLLTSVTWDSVGGAFADAVYGGYTLITFGLILGRMFQEIPRGRRILEAFYLGIGLLCFLILGGLELASLDSVPHSLIVNASVLGGLSLLEAALFLIDLMGPRTYTATNQSQTEIITSPKTDKKLLKLMIPPPQQFVNGNTEKQNGHLHEDKENETTVTEKLNGNVVNGKENGHIVSRPGNLDLENAKNDKMSLFDDPKLGYTKFEDNIDILEKSKFGSLRNIEGGNYVRLSDPLAEPDRMHYEQELAKFNEKYFRQYLESMVDNKVAVKESYLPEPQTPVFAKTKSGRLRGLYDDPSPTEDGRNSRSPSRVKLTPTPTLQQLEDYLKGSNNRTKRGDTPAIFPMEPIEEKDREPGDTEGRASGTPTDPGYVQYTASRWSDKRNLRTPRHSPT